jgi:hypothetical protein
VRWQSDDREFLQQSNQGVRDFHHCEILAETCSWAAVEWEIGPTDICEFARLPSLGTELVGVWSVDILASRVGARWGAAASPRFMRMGEFPSGPPPVGSIVVLMAVRLFKGTGG